MKIVQKKNENRRKEGKAMATVFCVLLLALTAAGCGKVEEPIPVDLSLENMEEPQDDDARESEDDPKEAADGDADSKNVSDGEAKVNAGDDMNENAEGDTGDDTIKKAGQDDTPNESAQQTEETQPKSVGNAELDGNVRSIGADSFVVARAETWTEGDASYMVSVAPGYEEEEELVTVHADQNCVWEFKTVKNGGIDPEDVSTREGSFADLKEGIAINSKGSWQDDGSFLADRIVMMKFV